MFSTRKLVRQAARPARRPNLISSVSRVTRLAVAAGAGAAALLPAGGCSYQYPQREVAQYSETPLIVDEAMQKRDWEPSTAYFSTGAFEAGDRKSVV